MIQKELIKSIKTFLKTDFEKKLLDQALINLKEDNNIFRINDFAYKLRVLIEKYIVRFATEEEIKKTLWYEIKNPIKDCIEAIGIIKLLKKKCKLFEKINKLEKIINKIKPYCQNAKEVTLTDKIKYLLIGGLKDCFIEDELHIEDLNSKIKALIKIRKKLNKYTHMENSENINNYSNEEIFKEANNILGVVNNFFLDINSLRISIVKALEKKILKRLDEIPYTDAMIGKLDILSTHTNIEDIELHSIEIKKIDYESIKIEICGTIYFTLQYGSDMECVKDGTYYNPYSTCLPYKINTYTDINDPLEIDITSEDVDVDTSLFYK